MLKGVELLIKMILFTLIATTTYTIVHHFFPSPPGLRNYTLSFQPMLCGTRWFFCHLK